MNVTRVGPFELDPDNRTLCIDGRAVELGARAFDLLLVLVENAGRLVPKATLLERVWPRLVVDENNLPAQVASLRRILGADAIRTVPGFGYRLELEVARAGPAPPEPATPAALRPPEPLRSWPQRLTSLVGRDDDVRHLESSLATAPLVTIVGAAGIGKTRLAEELLARGRVAPAEATAFVSVASLDAIAQVPPAIALALAASLPDSQDGFLALDDVLGRAPRLLVLDSVEHLAAPLAAPLAALLARNRGLRMLVTSQAPLGIAGEVVYRLGPLAVPRRDCGDGEAADSPAVTLFAQRAAAADRTFELGPANARTIAEICTRLDGNPLALELAAARVPALGVNGLNERLDDRFRLLRLSGRTENPRQSALHAAFEWSYGLLSPAEQQVFSRLGAFSGSFSLQGGARSVANGTIDPLDAIDLIGRLVDRSLVTVSSVDPPRYSLPETARFFAIERLTATGELEVAKRNMAETVLDQLDAAYLEYWSLDEAIWLRRYAPELDNVRAAIDWAAEHDRTLGASLYGSAWPLFVEAELFTEARARYEQTVRLLSDTVPRARLSRFWEAVATFDSTLQCDRARYAAELAASHADASDHRARYYALMLLAINSRDDASAAREAFAAARGLEDAAWPPRLLTVGALAEGTLLMGAGDLPGARAACRRAVRLGLSVSERQALAASVKIVELDTAGGDSDAALQIGRPLSLTLRHSGRHATRIDLLIVNFSALLLGHSIEEARQTGAELYALAARLRPGRLYSALDAMALLTCEEGRFDDAARIACYADVAHEAHGLLRRGPIEERIRSTVCRRLEDQLGPNWRSAGDTGARLADEGAACALALGLDA